MRGLPRPIGDSTRKIEKVIGGIQHTGQTVDALLTSADQPRHTQDQAQSASAALETIAKPQDLFRWAELTAVWLRTISSVPLCV